jgi:hypothetical protein
LTVFVGRDVAELLLFFLPLFFLPLFLRLDVVGTKPLLLLVGAAALLLTDFGDGEDDPKNPLK